MSALFYKADPCDFSVTTKRRTWDNRGKENNRENKKKRNNRENKDNKEKGQE